MSKSKFRLKEKSVLPGFGLSLGYSLLYLSALVLVPLSLLFFKAGSGGWDAFVHAAFSERALASYKVTFGCSLFAATINLVFGLLLAWVLVRYSFPGKSFFDAIVDLPFALPTAVGGIALVTAYDTNGFMGRLITAFGKSAAVQWFTNSKIGVLLHSTTGLDLTHIKVTESPLGITIALTFISLPFVVRTVQPVLQELDAQVEEAASSLGAGRWFTFRRVIFPYLFPALLTGFALGFARAIGEYGSVVFIAGNLPMKTEIAPLLIITKLEEYDYTGATSIAVVMLVVSFILLLSINGLQWWSGRRSAA